MDRMGRGCAQNFSRNEAEAAVSGQGFLRKFTTFKTLQRKSQKPLKLQEYSLNLRVSIGLLWSTFWRLRRKDQHCGDNNGLLSITWELLKSVFPSLPHTKTPGILGIPKNDP